MATNETAERIVARLYELEKRFGMRVLYACESGSRAWGFPSSNSDYDVRGIYLFPRDAYLMLERPPETLSVIEGDLDIHLWDIYKFMTLAQRSNPSALEWIGANEVYVKAPLTLRQHWIMAEDHHWWSRQRLMHHYLGLAKSEYHKYIADRTQERVKTKAYFYVIRPLFILEWLFRYNTLPANQNLMVLVSLLTWGDMNPDHSARFSPEIRSAIATLAFEKIRGDEFDAHQRVPLLDAFIERELEHWKTIQAEWDVKEKPVAIYAGHASMTLLDLHEHNARRRALKPLDTLPE